MSAAPKYPKPKVISFILVRGPDGKPRFDDIHNVPWQLKAMLTEEDKKFFTEEELEILGLTENQDKET